MWPKPNLFTALSVVHAPLIHTGETPFKDPTHLWAHHPLSTSPGPATRLLRRSAHALGWPVLDGLSLMVGQFGH
jgi:hypothetical protein